MASVRWMCDPESKPGENENAGAAGVSAVLSKVLLGWQDEQYAAEAL